MYKYFFSKQFDIPIENIDIQFFIVKRKIWEESEYPMKRVQEFAPPSGKNKTNKAIVGHLSKSKTTPKKVLKEFRIDNKKNLPQLGDIIDVNQFNPGEFITITGYSIGKGFAGHMKRHGFSGGRASHGKNSVMRKAGSIGAGTDPSRVFKGMKMAGRSGNENITIKNLEVLKVDNDNNLIFVNGSIPGASNGIVYISKIS